MQSTCICKHSLSALARRWKSKQVPFQIIPPSLEAFPIEAFCRVVVGSIRMKSKKQNGYTNTFGRLYDMISGGFEFCFLQMFLLLLLLSCQIIFSKEKISLPSLEVVFGVKKKSIATSKNNQKDFKFFRNFFDKKTCCAILTLNSGSDKNAMHGFYSLFLTLNTLGTK